MKKEFLFFTMMALAIGLSAQTEVTFDFNNYENTGDPDNRPPLNGQDGWITKVHSAGNGGRYMYTDYMAYFWGSQPWTPTPDDTIRRPYEGLHA